MAKNEFLPVATGVGANALTPAEYASAEFRQQGFQAGTARSSWHNAVFRQSSTWAAILGQFTADYGGSDVLDDGDLAKLQDQFEAALKVAFDIPLETERWHYGRDTSTSANRLVVDLPAVAGDITEGFALAVLVNNINTSSVLISVNGQADLPVTRVNGASLYAGDIIKPGVALLVHDGAKMQLVNPQTIGEIAGLPAQHQLLHYGRDTSTTPNAIVATVEDFGANYVEGLPFAVRIANTNTGGVTIKLNGKAAVPLTKGASGALSPGDVVQDRIAFGFFDQDGASAQLINPQTGTGGGGGSLPPGWNSITGSLAGYWLTVLSATTATPPLSPTVGDLYLIPAGATGEWASREHRIAQRTDDAWVYRSYPKGSVIGVQGAGAALADILERTATGWRSKFATQAETDAGTNPALLVSPVTLQGALQPIRDAIANLPGVKVITTNTTLSVPGFYFIDTRGGPITLTLPANPALNTAFTLADPFNLWDVNPVLLARNGKTIMERTDNLNCALPNVIFTILYSGTTWKLA